MRRLLLSVAVATCVLAVPVQASANIVSLEASQAEIAATAIMAEPSLLSSASLLEWASGAEEQAAWPIGIGDKTLNPLPKELTSFPTAGNTYAMLSSGDVNTIANQLTNEAESTSTEFEHEEGSQTARGEGAQDWTVLRLNVNVPVADNCLALDYRFLSEEFPEFVGSPFNDAFIAELDTTSWSVSNEGSLMRSNDFASSLEGTPISVNGVGPAAVSPQEAEGTYFDAATGLITTKTPITPGAHSIYLSIFDASDHIYDSAVFLDNLRFVNESSATCRPPLSAELVVLATPPPSTTTAPPPPPPSNSFTLGPSVKFKNGGTSAKILVNVPGPGTVSATQPTSSASSSSRHVTASTARAQQSRKKRKKPLVAPSSIHVKAAGPATLTIRLSGAGKASLAKYRKLKVAVQITFTPDGGSPASQVKTLTFRKPGKSRHGKK